MKSIEILVPEEIVNLLGSEDAVRKEAHAAFIKCGEEKFPKARRLNCWA